MCSLAFDRKENWALFEGLPVLNCYCVFCSWEQVLYRSERHNSSEIWAEEDEVYGV